MRQRVASIALSLLVLAASVSGCAKTITVVSARSDAAPTTGTILVNATLDGSPWRGPVSLRLTGQDEVSVSDVPWAWQAPPGEWDIAYGSGPVGARLAVITPFVPQTLAAGGTITFTVHFGSQAPSGTSASGTISVNATLDGSPWEAPVRSIVSIRIGGTWYRTGIGGASVPQVFADLPSGFTYKVSFIFSGRIGGAFMGVAPPEATLTYGASVLSTFRFSTAGCGGG